MNKTIPVENILEKACYFFENCKDKKESLQHK